jgi:hypothetical protein
MSVSFKQAQAIAAENRASLAEPLVQLVEPQVCHPQWLDKDNALNKTVFVRTPHSLDQVLGENYFGRLANALEMGDRIEVNCGLGVGSTGAGHAMVVGTGQPLEFGTLVVSRVIPSVDGTVALVEVLPLAVVRDHGHGLAAA